MLEKYPIIKTGKNPGKTSVILAGIHGNEPCGIVAFESILDGLNIENGTVIFQIGNPKAVEKNVRFVDMNLNRAFKNIDELTENELKTYEYGVSVELKSLLDKSDALLDIHSSRNIDSKQFVITEPKNNFISEQLPFDLVVSGFDEFEPGGTDSYMNLNNKIGICVECGQHDDPTAVDKAIESISSFLVAMGHTTGNNNKVKQEKISINFLYKNTNSKFTLSKVFKDFENISKDTIIGMDGDTVVTAPYDSKILFAHNIEGSVGQECFLLAV